MIASQQPPVSIDLTPSQPGWYRVRERYKAEGIYRRHRGCIGLPPLLRLYRRTDDAVIIELELASSRPEQSTLQFFSQQGRDYALVMCQADASDDEDEADGEMSGDILVVIDLESGQTIAKYPVPAPYLVYDAYVPQWAFREPDEAGAVAFLAGKVDWGKKPSALLYVDLSHAAEGIVAVEDRYPGIHPLEEIPLHQSLMIDPGTGMMHLAVSGHVHIDGRTERGNDAHA